MKKIAVTSYCGTGSSAVIDLLSEYRSCTTNDLRRYEHILFYDINGIFDLEDKLLRGIDVHRSDEAIKNFKKSMMKLYKNNFGWFGSYEVMYGEKFKTLVDDFINELPHCVIKGKWYWQYEGVKFSFIKVILQFGSKILQNRTIHKWGRQYIIKGSDNMVLSFPTEEEFFTAARKFINGYLELISGNEKKNIIFDHLLLPHNAFRLPNYFDEDFRLIIVDRDVRDMYTLTSHVWPAINSEAPFPKNCNDFIDFWGRMKNSEKYIEDSRIYRLQFEDLIYDYEETIDKLEGFIGLKSEDHIYKKKYFDPEKSIKNTQNFLIESEWDEEAKKIAKALPKYVYKFPYKIKTSIKETFDN